MERKRRIVLLLLALLIVFPCTSFAELDESKGLLVSLGDSITAGFNLSDPETESFPYLINNDRYTVQNLGVPGWTSGDLLEALLFDETYQNAISTANVITIYIGSNDFLQALKLEDMLRNPSLFDPEKMEKDIKDATDIFSSNLRQIMDIVQSHSAATILLYTIYNPVISDESFLWELLYFIADEMINDLNSNIISNYNFPYNNVEIVDAYSVFSRNQEAYIISGDIHPNADGHKQLADLAITALLKPLEEEGQIVDDNIVETDMHLLDEEEMAKSEEETNLSDNFDRDKDVFTSTDIPFSKMFVKTFEELKTHPYFTPFLAGCVTLVLICFIFLLKKRKKKAKSI